MGLWQTQGSSSKGLLAPSPPLLRASLGVDRHKDLQIKLPASQPPAFAPGLEGAGHSPSISPPGHGSCPWASGLEFRPSGPFPCPLLCAVCHLSSLLLGGTVPPRTWSWAWPCTDFSLCILQEKGSESRKGWGRPGHLGPISPSWGSSPQFLLVPPLSQVPNSHNLPLKLPPLWGLGPLVSL